MYFTAQGLIVYGGNPFVRFGFVRGANVKGSRMLLEKEVIGREVQWIDRPGSKIDTGRDGRRPVKIFKDRTTGSRRHDVEL
jgi:hypothetical protein